MQSTWSRNMSEIMWDSLEGVERQVEDERDKKSRGCYTFLAIEHLFSFSLCHRMLLPWVMIVDDFLVDEPWVTENNDNLTRKPSPPPLHKHISLPRIDKGVNREWQRGIEQCLWWWSREGGGGSYLEVITSRFSSLWGFTGHCTCEQCVYVFAVITVFDSSGFFIHRLPLLLFSLQHNAIVTRTWQRILLMTSLFGAWEEEEEERVVLDDI